MRKRLWLGLALVGGAWLLLDHTRSRAEPEPAAAAPVQRDAHELVRLISRLPIARPAAIERPVAAAPERDAEDVDETTRDQFDTIVGQIPEGQGAAFGEIRDTRTGELAPGATIVVTSIDDPHAPEFVVLSDELGRYAVIGLAPGAYKVRVYYDNSHVDRDGLVVLADGATPLSLDIDPDVPPAPEPPVIENIATGRTFEGVIGVAAGSQEDTYGVAISSNCASNNEFLEETEVIAGGTNAEYRGARLAE